MFHRPNTHHTYKFMIYFNGFTIHKASFLQGKFCFRSLRPLSVPHVYIIFRILYYYTLEFGHGSEFLRTDSVMTPTVIAQRIVLKNPVKGIRVVLCCKTNLNLQKQKKLYVINYSKMRHSWVKVSCLNLSHCVIKEPCFHPLTSLSFKTSRR